jgi:hypothetical protein
VVYVSYLDAAKAFGWSLASDDPVVDGNSHKEETPQTTKGKP